MRHDDQDRINRLLVEAITALRQRRITDARLFLEEVQTALRNVIAKEPVRQ